ncbi:SLC6A5 [Cordylochernes scorpioides]|uniref:Transporter n=1 Tax=Cordylochernes scorpioides TaxID=51811 RepID=A0ABY6LDL6_9ARAC|nr:SLC6A5 [Cordylochernes scorpioides]
MSTEGQGDVEAIPGKSSKIPQREHWKTKHEFLLSCIGLSVGFGNVWRFPFLAYEHGGGSFLFIYAIFLFTIGSLLIFFEISIGQFTSQGPVEALHVSKAFRLFGLSGIIINFYIAFYYNVIMTYVFFYFYHSFMYPLPWSDCYQWWGATKNCQKKTCIRAKSSHQGLTDLFPAISSRNYSHKYLNCGTNSKTPSEEFWEIYVLGKTKNIYDLGYLKWNLVIPYLLSWGVVFFFIYRGINSAGKLVYFTALSPFILLAVLGGFAGIQDGATNGLVFFFFPRWEMVANFSMWHRAMEQVLYSVGIAMGGLVAFGSYNQFHERNLLTSVVLVSADFIGSLLGGILNFCVIGNLAHRLDTDIDKVLNQGLGLAFVTYPEALSHIWFPNLWSILFFLTMFLLGIDSQFGMLQAQMTTIYDRFHGLRAFKTRVSMFICLVYFLFGLVFVTQGGIHVLTFVDSFGGSLPLLTAGFLEVSSVMWGYGWRLYFRDMEFMQRIRFPIYVQVLVGIFLPLVLIGLLTAGMIGTKITDMNKDPYRPGLQGLGILMTISCVVPPLVYFLMSLVFWPQAAFKLNPKFGPKDPTIYKEWKDYIAEHPLKSKNPSKKPLPLEVK